MMKCEHPMEGTHNPRHNSLATHTLEQTHTQASLSLYTANAHVPNLSSPKLPQPIFFPTLKLGPTIRTELWLEGTSREPREDVVP